MVVDGRGRWIVMNQSTIEVEVQKEEIGERAKHTAKTFSVVFIGLVALRDFLARNP